jgi:hypothetical protein
MQTWVWGSRTIPLDVQTQLTLDDAGKITKHHDKWVGKFAPWWPIRRFTGASSTLLMRMAGWGKPAAAVSSEQK